MAWLGSRTMGERIVPSERSEGDREGLSARGNAKRPASAGLAVQGQVWAKKKSALEKSRAL
jgi:hypothetical protein